MAALDDRQESARAKEIRQAQKIKSGLSLELKGAIDRLAQNVRTQAVSEDDLRKLIEMKLAEKKFGRPYLTELGRIVSLV